MEKIRLSKEEKAIEDALVRGEYVKVKPSLLKEISESLAARKKDVTMTIRVNSKDIQKIKKKADALGIKYQTFISEVIHQIAAH